MDKFQMVHTIFDITCLIDNRKLTDIAFEKLLNKNTGEISFILEERKQSLKKILNK